MSVHEPRRLRQALLIGGLVAMFVGLVPTVGSAFEDPFGDNDPFDAIEPGEFVDEAALEYLAEDPGDFGKDPLSGITGTLAEICGPNDESKRRPGRLVLVSFFKEWPGIRGVGGFNCREKKIRNKAACQGRSRPAWSDCWSTHATGRGLDLHTCSGSEQGCTLDQSEPILHQEVGDGLADWLLEEVDGYPAYRARLIGVMEILWHDHCWAPTRHANDKNVTSAAEMRPCKLAFHDNHLHLTLSNAGADGQTAWFDGSIPVPPPTAPPPQAVEWYLRDSNSNGGIDREFDYGHASDVKVVGDWDGDGVETPGVFRDGRWFLRNSNTTGAGDLDFWFGSSTDVPVVGDWNNDGIDTVGVFRDGRWLLRNSNSNGGVSLDFWFGSSTDVPVVGDWNNDGIDTVGVFRDGRWLLRNSNSNGGVDLDFWFGSASDVPVVGDWNNDGIDTVGVARDV